jgi:hypothetical protein
VDASADSVGIGTSSPGNYRLKTVGAGFAFFGNNYFNVGIHDGSASQKGVAFGYNSTSQTGIIAAETSSAASNLAFFTFGGVNWAEGMRIDSSSNVGIGVTNQNEKLVVNGAIRSTNNAAGATATADSGVFYFIPTADAPSDPRTVLQGVGTASVGASVVFYTGNSASNSERMRIDPSGNVGIGNDNTGSTNILKNFTTSHQVGSRGAAIDFGMDDGSFTGMSVVNAASSDPSYNAQFITFETHMGGVSAGERMRIDSSGNLLVGKTASMVAGVGIEVGEVGIDGVSGFGMTSAVSIADDATITLSANTGLLVFIEYFSGGAYPGAMFYCSYAGAVQLVSNSGGNFAATDSDTNACVFKGSNTDVVTVKNRLGATVAYSIHTLHMRGQ